MIISIFERKKEKKKVPTGSKTSKNDAMHGKQDDNDNQGRLGAGNHVSKSAAKDPSKKRASPAPDRQSMIGVGSTSSGTTPASDAKDKQDVIRVGHRGSTSAATGNAGTGPAKSGQKK